MPQLIYVVGFVIVSFLNVYEIHCFRCDRRPYGSTTLSSQSDGRFKLQVINADKTYMPDQLYTIQITATDEESLFTSFIVSAEGDMKQDSKNPRRTVALLSGEIRPVDQSTARFSDRCQNSVEQVNNSPKSNVELYWQAPASGNGCVTIRAMVAENQDVWFEDGGPLTRKICEDTRQPDDVTPNLNMDCQICDEAKYELSFTGMWSRNTQPRLYPENDWIPKYSDLVGASHSPDYVLWSPGMLASEGFKDLAEYANTSKLEEEIKEKIGDGVRTLLKGKGHGYRKMNYPTYTFFRVDKINHLFTAAVALYPSPDWFLGVTRFELCQSDNTWLSERELDLYPWDAGTDSGVSYESANIQTFPQDAISRVQMSSYDKNSPFYEMDMKDLHPFGKMNIKLIRTYHRECENIPEDGDSENPDAAGDNEPNNNPDEPEDPSRYQNPELDSSDSGRQETEAPVKRDPDSPEDCPMSSWQDWSPCEGACENGQIVGFKWRERYHLVDGVAVEKYNPDAKDLPTKEVSQYCKETYEDFERIDCQENCSNDIQAQRRIPPKPGDDWASKKRDVADNKIALDKI